MSHDPLRDAFERMAPPSVSPTEARDRLGALSPGFRTARRNHRIRTGIAGVTAAVALAVGGPLAIAAISPGASTPQVDFASPDDSTEDLGDSEDGEELVGDDSPDTDTSSSSEDAPFSETETTDTDEVDDTSDDSGESGSDVLGQGADDDVDHDAGDDSSDADSGDGDHADSGGDDADDSDSDDHSSDHDDSDHDDDDDDSDHDDDDESSSGVPVEGQTYSKTSLGGTLSVRVVDGALELVAAVPAPGFSEDVDERDDEIRVDFRSADEEVRIEAELEYGQLVWRIED